MHKSNKMNEVDILLKAKYISDSFSCCQLLRTCEIIGCCLEIWYSVFKGRPVCLRFRRLFTLVVICYANVLSIISTITDEK